MGDYNFPTGFTISKFLGKYDDMERDKVISIITTRLAEPLADLIRGDNERFSDQHHETHIHLTNNIWRVLKEDTNDFLLKVLLSVLAPERFKEEI
tara:strand:- start:4443 stop:4727 length:285 start_codon:yes stop_codon:yes gene_type:complete